jgi:anhydro-N-acetylmuramic acid kinase
LTNEHDKAVSSLKHYEAYVKNQGHNPAALQPGPDAVLFAIGLMSGTSVDGIDAALIETDGRGVVKTGAHITVPYPQFARAEIKAAFATAAKADPTADPAFLFAELSSRLAEWHADVVNNLVDISGVTINNIDIIGFHGQTVLHRPDIRKTWQIGDAAHLARLTGVDVVADFRARDVAEGGQGAPLVPLYHAALVATARRRELLPADQPVAVLNLGGVGNVSWISASATDDILAFDILAFDTGPGNALIDDWMALKTGTAYDAAGQTASRGQSNPQIVDQLLGHAYFNRKPPKSLDRHDFVADLWGHLSLEDGAATLTEFTTRSVKAALSHMPQKPAQWIVCGGGRHNYHLMQSLSRHLEAAVRPAEDMGWQGDALEAEAFGYLAVRSLKGLPLSLPTTTGVPGPMRGGRLFRP